MQAILTVPEEKLEELRVKWPDAVVLTNSETGDAVVMRPPSRQEYKRFRAMLSEKRTELEAAEVLLRTCIAWPDAVQVEAALDRRPALVEAFFPDLVKLAGFNREAGIEKKALSSES